MIFNRGDVVYSMPIRFWEDKEPIRCIVQDTKKTKEIILNTNSEDSVYVYSELYKHNVYINRKDCFFDETKCRAAIDLYSKLHDLYFKDESDEVFRRSIAEMDMKE